VGVVAVPDERLDRLADMYHPVKVTPAVVEFVDIAGLVKGASKGEGLGNKFLSHIREVDAIVHVVRCFEDGNIVHVDGSVDPARDIETINFELIFADLELVDKRIEKNTKLLKTGDKKYKIELDILARIKQALEDGKNVRSLEFSEEEAAFVRELALLTKKPIIYAANVSEDDIAGGAQLPMYQVITATIRASKARRVMDGWQSDFLTVPEVYYLATTSAQRYFGGGAGFAVGDKLHAIVVDDGAFAEPVRPLTLQERFERSIYLMGKENIRAVWSEGRCVLDRTNA